MRIYCDEQWTRSRVARMWCFLFEDCCIPNWSGGFGLCALLNKISTNVLSLEMCCDVNDAILDISIQRATAAYLMPLRLGSCSCSFGLSPYIMRGGQSQL